ncbi:hypothetical protein BCR25_04940 [Enterococcus termitis]|uniref:Uncharacterized protein n=1 Tax=Enterococcus termitis TaxID=332950 RepID=A0A1E5GKN3_9ENTE|nr:hypothetical protein BCR25_04940 [Enterococcus termitis]
MHAPIETTKEINDFTRFTHELENKDKVKLYVLYQIENKKWKRGTTLSYKRLSQEITVPNNAYKMALEFLEGAGLIVNEVVIEEKVPATLIERYGVIVHGK